MVSTYIFDLDGTLINIRIYSEMYLEILKLIESKLGLFGEELDIKAALFGLVKGDHGRYDSGDLCRELGLLAEYYEILDRHIKVRKRVHDDAFLVLSELKKKGLRVGVASNSMHRTIQSYLNKYDLLEFVDFIFSSEDAGRRKNDPVFWERLIAAEDLVPTECLIIGDSKLEDIEVPGTFEFNGFYVGEGEEKLRDVLKNI